MPITKEISNMLDIGQIPGKYCILDVKPVGSKGLKKELLVEYMIGYMYIKKAFLYDYSIQFYIHLNRSA